ncbi:LysR family transcriptional regulator [Ruegeria sp. 2012CJ41-6]|uniref:LysR family transcriptional regulator n=1 Tax=Ruegeria spongiae TaxID=2942209 RepID=A0ABT0Q1I8_9RHOB|nr:LysR family transcriptional regulator [Ruegeria spongiae]MCL6283653.1 LysR family transcriptional regulator [Ruegeria spongiae]
MSKRKVGLPPLDWLRVFEAAGRLGGFSAAAREFGLTQAAVSQRIANLEAWLGRSLFIREARGVSLTVEGESYLPLVQDSLRALERNTENLFGKSPTELRVAGLNSHLGALVVSRLAGFHAAHPNLRLVIDSLDRWSGFDEEKTWLQLRFGNGVWPGRAAHLVAREVLAPMAAPGLSRGAPLVELRGPRPGWSDWSAETGETMTSGWLSVDSMEHALAAARQGMGITLGSVPLARDLLQSGALHRLELPEFITSEGYWLTWPEDRPISRKQHQLVDAFYQAIRMEK